MSQAPTRARWAAGSWGPQNTSLMASAPASTPLRSWCVLESVCRPTCCPTGSGVEATLVGIGAAVMPRSGAASLIRPGPSGSGCSVRTAALGPTRSLWWPPAGASATPDSRMTPDTRTHLSTVADRVKIQGRLNSLRREPRGRKSQNSHSCLYHEVY